MPLEGVRQECAWPRSRTRDRISQIGDRERVLWLLGKKVSRWKSLAAWGAKEGALHPCLGQRVIEGTITVRAVTTPTGGPCPAFSVPGDCPVVLKGRGVSVVTCHEGRGLRQN